MLRISCAGFTERVHSRSPILRVGYRLWNSFEPDVIVEDAVILELKSGRAIDPAHEAQLLNYLRATQIEVGLLLNFGPKPEFKRLVFDNERKKIRGRG